MISNKASGVNQKNNELFLRFDTISLDQYAMIQYDSYNDREEHSLRATIGRRGWEVNYEV